MANRVLAICLDGFEESLVAEMIAAGDLPALSALRGRSARYLLEYGSAQRSGLAGEHLSTGLDPVAGSRHAAVVFDPETYQVWQEGTNLAPFPSLLSSRTVVFDATYFDLKKAPNVRGIVNWGAHDPGVSRASSPLGLLDELLSVVGPYPATQWLYADTWASSGACYGMRDGFTNALKLRAKAARWLLGERMPDWDLALLFISEVHAANEAMWHGIDPEHPLRNVESAKAAGIALRDLYRRADEFVGEMVDAFPDVTLAVFSLGGMGTNHSDVPSMALLAELLYRDHFGGEFLVTPPEWRDSATGYPGLADDESWGDAVGRTLGQLPLPARISDFARHALHGFRRRTGLPLREDWLFLDWLPAARYQSFWREMPMFAIPSYYDGRVRLNLKGREAKGIVSPSERDAQIARLRELLTECRDTATGRPVLDQIEVTPGDPTKFGPTEADAVVTWNGVIVGFDHPRLGKIGPLPMRRTGGHTGKHGFAYFAGSDLPVGDGGVASSFDVVPTLISLTGELIPAEISGRSLTT